MNVRRPSRPDPPGEALFEQAMRDVEPLAEPVVRRPARRGPVPAARVRGARSSEERAGRFELFRFGEQVEGTARGTDPAAVGRLRRGEVAVGHRLDLHGLSAEAARDAVRDALARATAAGLTAVLIVHGRGLRSQTGPILKDSLPAWLAEPPHGRRVAAFATAPPALGGAGATLVLLRRR